MSTGEDSAVPSQNVLPVIEVGLQAGAGVREGGWVPVVLVDASRSPDLSELIRIHEHFDEGDVSVAWARPAGASKSAILLRLRCERPLEANFVLVFAMPEQAGAVQSIVQARSLYLQHGPSGHLSAHLDEPRLLIEVPETGFIEYWEKIFHSAAAKRARNNGASFSQSREIADGAVAELKRFLGLRLRSGENRVAETAADTPPTE